MSGNMINVRTEMIKALPKNIKVSKAASKELQGLLIIFIEKAMPEIAKITKSYRRVTITEEDIIEFNGFAGILFVPDIEPSKKKRREYLYPKEEEA